MVGRNSSMLLTAFCMIMSNTHIRGRHSSSISLVDDGGKYLWNAQEGVQQRQTWAQIGADKARLSVDTNALIDLTHTAQLEIKATHYPVHKWQMITEDATYSLQLLIKAFKTWSTELQTSRERRCGSLWRNSAVTKHMSWGYRKKSTFRLHLISSLCNYSFSHWKPNAI